VSTQGESHGCGAVGKLPAAEAVDLAGLVSYGEGAIVSRTLVENEAGTLTLFACDKGQGLREHSTPFDAVVQVLEGEVELTIGGKPIAASAGQMVLMPAHVPHAGKAVGRFKMLLTMMRLRSTT